MTIDWSHFTPWTSLFGGMLIGLAAALLIIFNGRIAGISGIVGGLIGDLIARDKHAERLVDALFVLGLLLAPLLWRLFQPWPLPAADAPLAYLVIGGLLVGLGTRFGGGCTSGHGVCGLSRGSLRSLAATACFMGTGFATVFVMRHVWGHA
jgi:uncharacterized membrane protein YedE/YeeE